jgi:hypothetical protein
LVDPLPEGRYPKTHNANGCRHGSIPEDCVMELDSGLFALLAVGVYGPSSFSKDVIMLARRQLEEKEEEEGKSTR